MTSMYPAADSDRNKIKAFYKWMIDCLGPDEWSSRRGRLMASIQEAEASINLAEPIESQLYQPPEEDIDWYIFVAEIAWDHPYSDCAYNTKRIYPYAMAIGESANALRRTPGVEAVVKKMLRNNSSPESQIFELLTAAHYIKNGYQVEFIPENSITWPDNSKKTPDMRVKKRIEFYVECKRAAKQTKYSKDEETAWNRLWGDLRLHMLSNSPWFIAEVTFHCAIAEVSIAEIINVYDGAFKNPSKRQDTQKLSILVRPIDKAGLLSHYEDFAVRPNSPQQELLVFGNIDANEKRSIATIPARIKRPGDKDTVLNVFIEDVAGCVAAQWRCEHELSLDRRSRHFKGLMADAISQIPATELGVVHILYETLEGLDIENLRRNKHLETLAEFDASGSRVLGVLIHAVNYYPKVPDYDWAETVQHFARVPNFLTLLDANPLLLGNRNTKLVSQTTHWQQDAEARSLKR